LYAGLIGFNKLFWLKAPHATDLIVYVNLFLSIFAIGEAMYFRLCFPYCCIILWCYI